MGPRVQVSILAHSSVCGHYCWFRLENVNCDHITVTKVGGNFWNVFERILSSKIPVKRRETRPCLNCATTKYHLFPFFCSGFIVSLLKCHRKAFPDRSPTPVNPLDLSLSESNVAAPCCNRAAQRESWMYVKKKRKKESSLLQGQSCIVFLSFLQQLSVVSICFFPPHLDPMCFTIYHHCCFVS